jgi:hypothetical protein
MKIVKEKLGIKNCFLLSQICYFNKITRSMIVKVCFYFKLGTTAIEANGSESKSNINLKVSDNIRSH